MKTTIKSLLIFCFTLVICISIFTACGDEGVKITESEIRSALSSNEGTLSTEGEADNVTSFTYVITSVNAKDLSSKSFMRSAVKNLMNNPSKMTYGQYKSTKAFSAMVNIDGLFMAGESEDFNSDVYIDEILSVICDGTARTHNNWTISASIDTANDSITITVTSK